MNRTLKEATIRRYRHSTHDQLRERLAAFVTAYKFTKRLNTLKGLAPYEFIRQRQTKEPKLFRFNSIQSFPGWNT